MSLSHDEVTRALTTIQVPGGGNLVSEDMIRALIVDGDAVRFVIEVPSVEIAKVSEPLRAASEAAVAAIPGAARVQAVLTAPTAEKAPPSLKVGGHPKPQDGPMRIPGVKQVIAIASGKGGVGKSTVSSNLAVALMRQGKKVGLLDADIHGPSQPRMMGASQRPASPDGKSIIPLRAHGITLMSIGLMLAEDKAVIWRGPMLMGALQQMMGQVQWDHHDGELDFLIVDLPPGTGDVQLTLCTKAVVAGAIVVSTPQDVALLDARKALDMFATMKTPVLGLIENMSMFHCPDCGHEAHIFGHGGVAQEAKRLGLPFLGALPIDLETRLAGDGGVPVALGDGAMANAFADLAGKLVAMSPA
ncbi:ATP-binding protein involved in chromosome partitioning [Jannaschia faecimaris]|uniref:Iron-sulfur cluster carrier protein n=1 Tax=Jannaschia faecimaris TaxID=1244108 RepID=A0A1H3TQ39_9RHOB|nr:Mrp/NBP35 family ATP-binding protein [Jannaschia faecimaris]SDZ51449.1 ATP-binding protein involved in chromosome partitioning [Jannaschia faecimaris]